MERSNKLPSSAGCKNGTESSLKLIFWQFSAPFKVELSARHDTLRAAPVLDMTVTTITECNWHV